MRWVATELHGCLYLLPGQVRWLVAELDAEAGPRIEDGGVLEVEEAIFPPSPDSLASLLAERGVAWNVVVPLPVRTALARLPDLPAEELARGVPWEAEKVFRLADQDPVYDFELLAPPPTGADRSGPLALLVAMRRATVEHWREWTRRLSTPPARLEPAFTAGLRRLCATAADGPSTVRPCVHIQQDEGSAAVLILDESGIPLAVRNLALGPRRRGELAPLDGEDGIRALRETLLECEDRFPRMSLQALSAVGHFEPRWLEEAAFACQLPLVDPPHGPGDVPRALADDGRWIVPCGGLLGF